MSAKVYAFLASSAAYAITAFASWAVAWLLWDTYQIWKIMLNTQFQNFVLIAIAVEGGLIFGVTLISNALAKPTEYTITNGQLSKPKKPEPEPKKRFKLKTETEAPPEILKEFTEMKKQLEKLQDSKVAEKLSPTGGKR